MKTIIYYGHSKGVKRVKYAIRMNSFLREGVTVPQAIENMGSIDGVDYIDLNYPEHFQGDSVDQLNSALANNNIQLNAINLRFREQFINGEFGNSNSSISRQAVELCKAAANTCKQMGGRQIIIWLGFDGFDYSFQTDYVAVWNKIKAAFQEICDATDCPVSIEYKPYEERVHAFIDSFGTAALMTQAVNRKNFGVTLDFCHMLMKAENPACAAALLLEWGKLFGVHMNDGEGRTDDGLIVGMNNVWKTLEMFYYLKKYDYQGIVYFDTFPKREKAADECIANIAMCRKMEAMLVKVGMQEVERVIQANDATAVQRMFAGLLVG